MNQKEIDGPGRPPAETDVEAAAGIRGMRRREPAARLGRPARPTPP
jgi:hypothetical protein